MTAPTAKGPPQSRATRPRRNTAGHPSINAEPRRKAADLQADLYQSEHPERSGGITQRHYLPRKRGDPRRGGERGSPGTVRLWGGRAGPFFRGSPLVNLKRGPGHRHQERIPGVPSVCRFDICCPIAERCVEWWSFSGTTDAIASLSHIRTYATWVTPGTPTAARSVPDPSVDEAMVYPAVTWVTLCSRFPQGRRRHNAQRPPP
jgi:hypothetical protein